MGSLAKLFRRKKKPGPSLGKESEFLGPRSIKFPGLNGVLSHDLEFSALNNALWSKSKTYTYAPKTCEPPPHSPVSKDVTEGQRSLGKLFDRWSERRKKECDEVNKQPIRLRKALFHHSPDQFGGRKCFVCDDNGKEIEMDCLQPGATFTFLGYTFFAHGAHAEDESGQRQERPSKCDSRASESLDNVAASCKNGDEKEEKDVGGGYSWAYLFIADPGNYEQNQPISLLEHFNASQREVIFEPGSRWRVDRVKVDRVKEKKEDEKKEDADSKSMYKFYIKAEPRSSSNVAASLSRTASTASTQEEKKEIE